eukprot:INCI8166.1.p1 GENE.INCI8166.1~~INCI8166.1.p1  ORF type:complete len:130 (+),score=17.73 INCI8166.1:351-740(+)
MPAFNSASKPTLSGLSTTLNASSTVFQPGSSKNASETGSPLANATNSKLAAYGSEDSPSLSMARSQGNTKGKGREHHSHSRQSGYRSYKELFYTQRDYQKFESASILKAHDELPPQAIQAWNRYRSERD